MRDVGGPRAEVRAHGRLDRLHSFRLLGVVGDAVFRAVGVRDEERALAVVAAAGARRHRLRFTFFLPRRGHESSAPCSGVLTRPALRRFFCWLVANFDALFTRCGAVVCAFSLTEHLLNWSLLCPAHDDSQGRLFLQA